MDRNSAIGLTLITVILLGYFLWFSPPTPQPVEPTPSTNAPIPTQDSTAKVTAPVVSDSVLAATYGDMSAVFKGDEKITSIETDDLKINLSSKGGIITELELKKFKTYTQEPLKLITPTNNEFQLLTQYQGKEIDLYGLYYETQQQQIGDTTIVTFNISLSNGASLTQRYAIPKTGYEIGYSINSKSFTQLLSGELVSLMWANILRPVEKDLTETRNNSTITYATEGGYDELSQRSTGTETEVFSEPVKWVAIKEKFFLASIITKDQPFTAGEIQKSTNTSDSSVVKRANIKVSIPLKSITDGKANFKFYIGPNDYQVIGKVADDFAENVYLGWRPIFWINKFIIFPVFHFLTKYITNYGLIIFILVLLLKLVLLPLSYKSYLSMAKMRVLKPELDEIKERVGEDMTKVQQESMKLYQQVGVNPLSGCIPVLLQMPLIFAMFYLFPNSIELRQQSFLWAEDLSSYDSLIQLPFAMPFNMGSHISLFTVIMTISTLIYTWQNNQISSVTGPMKSMSYIMPVAFFFMLNSFPAGLTFYYFVSNLVTFAQQAIIKRFVDEDKIKNLMEENRKRIAAGGGTKSKFMNKLQEAMKASEEARKKAEEERKKRKK